MPSPLEKFDIGFLLRKDDDPTIERTEKIRFIIHVQGIFLLVLSLVLIAVAFTKEEKVLYFAANDKTDPKVIWGMAMPNHTNQAILSWIGSAASDILNFGFHNVQQRLYENRRYFTDKGWESFSAAIERSKIVEKIVEKQQVLTAAPVGAPVIINVKDGIAGPEWTVQIPFTVTVLSGKQTQAQRRILTVVIVRVHPSKNLSGLGINNWVETNA
ncbi:MAG: DotI/IcmL family type IV secretion protein [Bdellovibrionales bacterium]